MVFSGMAPLSIAVLHEPSLPTKNPEDRNERCSWPARKRYTLSTRERRSSVRKPKWWASQNSGLPDFLEAVKPFRHVSVTILRGAANEYQTQAIRSFVPRCASQ